MKAPTLEQVAIVLCTWQDFTALSFYFSDRSTSGSVLYLRSSNKMFLSNCVQRGPPKEESNVRSETSETTSPRSTLTRNTLPRTLA